MALAQARAAESPFSKGYEQLDELVARLESKEARKMTHSEIERELAKRGREIMRLLLQGYLDSRAREEACEPARDAHNVERACKRHHERELETEFGTVSVERVGYGGPTGLESLHPLDAELNLPEERYSHELRTRAAEEAAKTSYDEVVESLSCNTGAQIAKRQVEQLVIRAAQDFDVFYADREARTDIDAPCGSILVMTFDGKGVVTRKAAERRRHKCASRLSKGEKRNAKRTSTVASVYTLEPYVRTAEQVARTLAPVHEMEPGRRPRPENKRVWASLEKTPKGVMEDAFQARRHNPTFFGWPQMHKEVGGQDDVRDDHQESGQRGMNGAIGGTYGGCRFFCPSVRIRRLRAPSSTRSWGERRKRAGPRRVRSCSAPAPWHGREPGRPSGSGL